MRLATEHELAAFAEAPPQPDTDGAAMLAHPTAGRCLRFYALLTDGEEVAAALGLSEAERFWGRYYWLARFAREWQAIAGYDAGLEQQVSRLLNSAEHSGVALAPLPEVGAAVERDAVIGSTSEGPGPGT